MSFTRLNKDLNKDYDKSGIHPAQQQRSIVIRDAFIKAGFEHLLSGELEDLNIRLLASKIGVSVGAFYTRFQNKAAFLEALQEVIVHENNTLATQLFRMEIFKKISLKEAVNQIVNFMVNIYSGRGRGVLRASVRSIGQIESSWQPLRQSSRMVRALLVETLTPKLRKTHGAAAEDKIRFAYQIINGVMVNELINPWHVHKINDKRLKQELSALLFYYLK